MEKLMEAFQELQLLEEDVFNITADGVEEVRTFMDTPEDELDIVIDPEADTEEELKDSYIGKVIEECVICQSKIYRDPEEINIDEEGLSNVGQECPYCLSVDGFTVIGEVAEFNPNTEITVDEEGVYNEKEVEEDIEEEPIEVKDKEDLEESKKAKKVKPLRESKKLKEDISYEDLGTIEEIALKIFKDLDKRNFDGGPSNRASKLLRQNLESSGFEDDELEDAIQAAELKWEEWSHNSLEESKKILFKNSDRLAEELKLTIGIHEYKPWAGAVNTWDKIQNADMVSDLEDFLEDIYPNGLTVGNLNDILWFESEDILETLGLADEENLEESLKDELKNKSKFYKKGFKQGRDAYESGTSLTWKQGSPLSELKAGDILDIDDLDEADKKVSDKDAKEFLAGHQAGMDYQAERLNEKMELSENIRDNSEALSIIKVTNHMITFKNNLKTSLDVAEYPFLNTNIDYITVTRGDNHVLTIIYKDGNTMNFKWGESGSTIISSSLEQLRQYVVGLIRDNNIFYKLSTDAEHAEVYYYNGKWVAEVFGRNRERDRLSDVEWRNEGDVIAFIQNTYKNLTEITEGPNMLTINRIYTWFLRKPSTNESKKRTRKSRKLNEDTNVLIKTDDKEIKIDTEDGDVDVKVEEKENKETGDEMIAPLNQETEDKFEKEIEVEFDEFDQERFDDLQERYFKENFSNVKSYKTTLGRIRGNSLILEGLIEFKSGNKKKTTFVYESNTITKDNKLKFIGENKQFTNRNKAFLLTGEVKENKLMVESLSYDHTILDIETKELKRLNGNLK